MTDRPIPKGVSPETVREVVAGWAAAGAVEEPTYTADVEEETGIADAAGRQTRFLESLGVLDAVGQRHELTEAGADLARALDAGETERARDRLAALLDDWPPTEDLRDLLRGNPTERDRLVEHLAVIAGQDPDESRVSSGLGTLVDLYEWAGTLARDDADRYRLPESAAGVETELAELRDEIETTRESLSADLADARTAVTEEVADAHDDAAADRQQVALALADVIAAAERSLADSSAATRDAVASARDTLERDVAAAEMDLAGGRSAVGAADGTETAAEAAEAAEATPEATEESVEDTAEAAEDAPDTADEPVAETAETAADAAGASVSIRSQNGPGVVVEAGADPVEIDVDGGPTLELGGGAGAGDESGPVPDGGQVVEVADGATDATLGLELATDTEVTVQAGDGPGFALEPGADPVEIDVDGGPTVELSAPDAAEDAPDDGEAASEEAHDAAAEEVDDAGEGATDAAEDAAAPADEATDGPEEATDGDEAPADGAGDQPESDPDADASVAARPQTSREGEDAVAVSLDLALDADPDELAALVGALREGLLEELLTQADAGNGEAS